MPSDKWSAKNIETRARDVIVSIERIHQFIVGLNTAEFFNDQKTLSAVERELLTISEACRKISELESAQNIAVKNRLATRFPEIPWSEIRAIGNILRHDYGRVDPGVIWSTITGDDLHGLKSALSLAYPPL